jgi:hypothetical protein
MYLSQIPDDAGHPSAGHRRLPPPRARENWRGLAGNLEVTAPRLRRGAQHGNTFTEDWRGLVSHPEIDIIVNRQAIRSPPSSTRWKL